MRRVIAAFIVVLGVAAVLTLAPAIDAASEKKESARKTEANKQGSDELPAVITNDVLDRMFSGNEIPESTVTADGAIPATLKDEPAGPAEGAPGATPGAAPAAATPGAAAVEEVDPIAKAAELQAQIERLDKRLLSLRNPLLRGVTPATDEENAEMAGQGNVEQVRRTEEKLAELRAELAALTGGGN